MTDEHWAKIQEKIWEIPGVSEDSVTLIEGHGSGALYLTFTNAHGQPNVHSCKAFKEYLDEHRVWSSNALSGTIIVDARQLANLFTMADPAADPGDHMVSMSKDHAEMVAKALLYCAGQSEFRHYNSPYTCQTITILANRITDDLV